MPPPARGCLRSESPVPGGQAGVAGGTLGCHTQEDGTWAAGTRKGCDRTGQDGTGRDRTGQDRTARHGRSGNTQKKEGGSNESPSRKTAATYSPNWYVSTIGVDGLNFSVRNGKRWVPGAIATAIYDLEKTTDRQTRRASQPRPLFAINTSQAYFSTEKDFGLLVRVGFAIADFTPPAYLRRSLQRPSWKSHLGDGFALRCFQRLS